MGDKNNVKEVEITDTTVKVGHGVIKAIYTSRPGDNVWVVRDGTSSVQACGTVTFCTVVACDTVTVNGLVYTGVACAKANDTEFSVDCSDCAAATDLADSIDDDCRTPITVPALDHTSTATCAVVTIVAEAGQDGNLICLSSSCACTAAVSGAFLTGGTGQKVMTVEADAASHFSAPYINHPVALGIQVDHISGTSGAIVIVYE